MTKFRYLLTIAKDFLLNFIEKDFKGLSEGLNNKLSNEVLTDKFNLVSLLLLIRRIAN